MTALLEAWQDWECPNCHVTERTRPLPPNASRFHTCPKLHMLTAPLVRAGTSCKVVACERKDYLRKEQQRAGDDGKPYMAVKTIRDGGEDVAVFAPVAWFGRED
ncbi:MAG TPA: hypothetical protein VIV12_04240 [Streptosporangiaceae bacterium]